jgi:hypothetical protein
VVLHLGGDDDVALGEAQPEGQQVQRLGRVAGEEGQVRLRVAADEPDDGLARLLVPGAGELRFDAGPAVHARVPGQEVLHGLVDGDGGRTGGSGVEVDVLPRAAIQDGHPQVIADVLAGGEGRCHLHGPHIEWSGRKLEWQQSTGTHPGE